MAKSQKAPTAPSINDQISQYNATAPSVYQTNYDTMKQLYPDMMGLNSQLSQQASQGIQQGVPDWMRQQYQSDMNASLGSNAGSPMGADYRSRGLLDQAEQYRQYYQNMGIQLNSQVPALQGAMSGNYTPGQALNYGQQTYSTQAGIYGNQQSNQGTYGGIGTGLGAGLGFVATGGNPVGAMVGGMVGGGIGSSLNRNGRV